MKQLAEIIEGQTIFHASSSDNVRNVAKMMSDKNVGAAREIETGNLDVSLPVSRRRDEVGKLAQVFGRMVSALRENRQRSSDIGMAQVRDTTSTSSSTGSRLRAPYPPSVSS